MANITINEEKFNGKNVDINNGIIFIDGNEENVNLSNGINLLMKSEALMWTSTVTAQPSQSAKHQRLGRIIWKFHSKLPRPTKALI